VGRGRVALAVGVLASLVPLTAPGQAAQASREYAGTLTGEFDPGEAVENSALFTVSSRGIGARILLRTDGGFFGDAENPVCGELGVDSTAQPATFPDGSGTGRVVDEVVVSVGFSDGLCRGAPPVIETRTGVLTMDVTEAEVRGTLQLDDGGILSFVAPTTGGGSSSGTTLPPATTTGDGASGGGIAGLEELLLGVPISDDTIAVIEELVCGAGAGAAANQCAASDEVTRDFVAAIQDHVSDPEVLRTLRSAVALGELRAPDGLPIVPSMGHMFPVILQLAAQADAGDADALLALRRLLGGLINVATASRT
jgi:hypothetical protein